MMFWRKELLVNWKRKREGKTYISVCNETETDGESHNSDTIAFCEAIGLSSK
jgi:hypothetical protein